MYSKKKSQKKVFRFVTEKHYAENGGKTSFHFYNSRYFFVRYYAYLPFIYTLKEINFNNHRILDIGCADGPFLPTLNYYAKNIVGLDINQELIEKSKYITKNILSNSKKINLLTSDGLALPFRDESFNIILCFEVLEHVKDQRKVIEEIYRTLKKKGIFICSIPIEIGPSLFIRNIIGKYTKFHRPHYTKKELIQSILLKKPGLRTSEMSHKNFDWRLVFEDIKMIFMKTKKKFIPINFLKDFNPIVLIKSFKI